MGEFCGGNIQEDISNGLSGKGNVAFGEVRLLKIGKVCSGC